MLTLAEQIIAALPERIKRAEGDSPSSSSPPPPAPPLSSLEDALMEQMVSVLSYSIVSYDQIKCFHVYFFRNSYSHIDEVNSFYRVI